ncbi:MAG: hypothetical protein WD850_01970 [Candidatus Spechtbacterales bacterium]
MSSDTPQQPDAGVELLEEKHFAMKGPDNKTPLVGWKATSEGVGGLFNPRGFASIRAILWRFVKGEKNPLYDQPIIVENPGAVVIVVHGEKVALVRNFRMVGERILPKAFAGYVRQLDEQKLWGRLLQSMGKWRWEAPQGLIQDELPVEGENLEEFVLRSAKTEALQEGGLHIQRARIVGPINWSPTFCAHAQFAVLAEFVSQENATPEDLEIIGGMRFFSPEEIRDLNTAGELDSAMTLGALALCGIALPLPEGPLELNLA